MCFNTESFLCFKKNKNKKKGKDEKYGSEVTTPENSSSPGMMDMHGGYWKPERTPLVILCIFFFNVNKSSENSKTNNLLVHASVLFDLFSAVS